MQARNDNALAERTLGALLLGIVEQPLPPNAADMRVSSLTDDSRKVEPGGVFVAIRGTRADGRCFVDEAVRRGAGVVIGEDLPQSSSALVISAPDARETLARLAARWCGLDRTPASELRLIGVTGTNGKTTVAHMTQSILNAAGVRCGLLGTVRQDLCGRVETSRMTTPGPLELAERVAECAANGARAVVMEVSSHALDQRRAAGLRFAAAAFTNLTRDHLDYHKSMDAYCAAKARLFTQLSDDGVAVANVDDPHHEAVLGEFRGKVVTYALEREADVTAKRLRESIEGMRFRLALGGVDLKIESKLIGRHNVYNTLAAAGLAQALGVAAEAIERGLSDLQDVPGRMERISGLTGVDVFVDYAHTPDALRNAAGVLRPLARGRLIVLFGCGGERDREKRPMMAQAAAEFGGVLILTSDNPRGEDPQQIIDEALAGLDVATRRRTIVNVDRGAAIHAALAGAKTGDVVLIAGKGHETYQIIGGQRLPFDDRAAAREAIAKVNAPDSGER